ncbi:hypothetical protein Droror1_Dr00027394 [Drosera rotundifolia]
MGQTDEFRGPRLCCGDFNEILYNFEKQGGTLRSRRLRASVAAPYFRPGSLLCFLLSDIILLFEPQQWLFSTLNNGGAPTPPSSDRGWSRVSFSARLVSSPSNFSVFHFFISNSPRWSSKSFDPASIGTKLGLELQALSSPSVQSKLSHLVGADEILGIRLIWGGSADHLPIIVEWRSGIGKDDGRAGYGRRGLFRYENMWTNDKECAAKVRETWQVPTSTCLVRSIKRNSVM